MAPEDRAATVRRAHRGRMARLARKEVRLMLDLPRVLLAALACLTVGAAAAAAPGAAPPPRTSAGCGKGAPTPPGESARRTIEVADLGREYRLHLPTGYDPRTPVPLVLVFHGYTGSAETEDESTSFSRHADAHGYAVVYPQATGFTLDGQTITSWNDRACNASPGPEGSTCTGDARDYPTPPECGPARECDWCSCHDDVGFAAALLGELEATLCLDLDRIFATGISNGGMFVHRLACDLAGRFAAIAPVAGNTEKGFVCAPGPAPKASILSFYGTRDTVVPFDGRPAEDGFLYTPTAQIMAAWSGPQSQRCAAEDSPYPTSRDGTQGFVCTQRASCASGAEVVGCAWDGGHDWPRRREDQFGIDVIWEFFEKNGR